MRRLWPLALLAPVALAVWPGRSSRELPVSYSQDSGSYLQSMPILANDFNVTGGMFQQTNAITITGNVHIGSGASFIPNGKPITIGQKGKHTFLRIDPKKVRVTDKAIYSGSKLLRNTGSHLELQTPSLGNVIIQ